MARPRFDLTSFVPFLLNRVGTSVAMKFSVLLKDHGLDITTWRLIASVYQSGQMRIGELADFTGIELWTVSRVVTKIEKEGLLIREREGGDARAVTVKLTEDGTALIEKLIPQAREFEVIPLNGFTAQETKQLRSLLARLYDNVEGWDAAEAH